MASIKLLRVDYLSKLLIYFSITFALELGAAIAGTYYLKKQRPVSKRDKLLVYFLWLTFLIELFATYAIIAYFTDYKVFGFIKDTVFERNFWLYNLYSIISFGVLMYYFTSLISSALLRKIFHSFNVVFILGSIFYFLQKDNFFKTTSGIIIFSSTILLLLVIVTFYYSLLKSDNIIDLKKYLPIYISVGVLVFNLCVSPIDIFLNFFNSFNKNFVSFRSTIILVSNFIMYGSFIAGFIICSKRKQQI
jgi:hypothetical protein